MLKYYKLLRYNTRLAHQFSTSQKICLYKLLNVSTDATQEAVKDAYFLLAKKYHPDTNLNTTIDPIKFQQIQEAYQTLSNDEKRRIYDEINGIINISKYGDPSFGDQQSIYEQFSREDPESIYKNDQGAKAKADYFDKQYFNNKEYFKRKVNEGSDWNFSEKLFRQHSTINIDKKQWQIHQPFADQDAYYVHVDEFKQDTSFLAQTKRMVIDFKFLWLAMSFGLVGYSINYYLEEKGKGKQIINTTKLREGPGYKLKFMPINIT